MLIKQLFILLVLLISLVICILKKDKNLKNNVVTEEIKVFSIPPSRDGSIYFAYYLASKYILSHIPAVSPASSYHQKICMDIIYYCMLSLQQYMIGSLLILRTTKHPNRKSSKIINFKINFAHILKIIKKYFLTKSEILILTICLLLYTTHCSLPRIELQ